MQNTTWRRYATYLDALAFCILFVLYAAGAWAIATRSPIIWVDHIYDDAYYYLGVVRNLAEGRGSVFLPPFLTNGYQPLWTLVLWLTASMLGTSDISLALQIYTCSFIAALAFALLSKRYFGNAFLAIAFSISLPYINLLGMETCLIPPLVLVFFKTSNWLGKGFLGSLIFLSRLDGLALVISRDIIDVARGEKADLRHYLIIIPVLGFYFWLNFHQFGTPVPISGLAKSVGNISGENWGVALQYLTYCRYAAVLAVVAFIIKGKEPLPFKRELQVLCLTLAMCIGYYSLRSGWPIWGWYAWPAFLIMLILAQGILDITLAKINASAPQPVALKYGLTLVAVLSICYSLMPTLGFAKDRMHLFREALANHVDTQTFGRRNVELAHYFLDRKTAPNTMFAMGDRAGSFGFFLGSDMRFMHTEGLVGPYAYLKSMQKDEGKQFLESLPIDFFIVDREAYLEDSDTIGVAEPNQGLSAHIGPYLLCFPKSSITLDQSYNGNKRYVFDFRKRMACPDTFEKQFGGMRDTYQGIRKFSQPSRYAKDNLLSKIARRHIDIP